MYFTKGIESIFWKAVVVSFHQSLDDLILTLSVSLSPWMNVFESTLFCFTFVIMIIIMWWGRGSLFFFLIHFCYFLCFILLLVSLTQWNLCSGQDIPQDCKPSECIYLLWSLQSITSQIHILPLSFSIFWLLSNYIIYQYLIIFSSTTSQE